MDKDIAIGVLGREFDYGTGQLGLGADGSPTFFRSCVSPALSGGGGPPLCARFGLTLRM